MSKTLIFYDVEATSLSRDADIVSIGLHAFKQAVKCDSGLEGCACTGRCKQISKAFYAQFNDFNIDKADDWVKENVIDKLYASEEQAIKNAGFNKDILTVVFGDKDKVSHELKSWLSQFYFPEFWADYDTIDKPMLVDLIGTWNKVEISTGIWNPRIGDYVTDSSKIGVPIHLANINYYDFYDLHTLFNIKGINPDIDRFEFSEYWRDKVSHNALFDAKITGLCYHKLIKL